MNRMAPNDSTRASRRRYLSAVGVSLLAGCIGTESGADGTDSGSTNGSDDQDQEQEQEPPEEPEPEPEPEGGDGRPYTHYELDVDDERENGQPTWIDSDGVMYGREDEHVLVSEDWWRTTERLYTFDDLGDERVETVIVPDSGTVLVGVGGHFDETTGRLIRLSDDHRSHTTLFDFDWGYVSNSMGHAVYEDIVIVSCYAGSDYAGGNHANEVIVSTDGGHSFEKVLEVESVDSDAANNHIHDVEYDPYAERIWVAVGDHGNSQIYWSDDLGNSWTELTERGGVTMITQVAAFKDAIAFGTDGDPEGIILWRRDGPDDEPGGATDLERPHVEIETDPDDDTMEMYARRRWHIRENLDGRELCLMPFGYSPMHETAEDSVVLASTDGIEWYELVRTETRDILLTNVMGPLSMDGERRTVISDSNQGKGYQIEGTVPEFWDSGK